MWPLIPHGVYITLQTICLLETYNMQHCLLTWIQQESSKGLCPMCRQSKSLPADLHLHLLTMGEFEWKQGHETAQQQEQQQQQVT